jgi:hypothetical protein
MVLMDADWYADPLGRCDGRFFDGERWTESVSDAGAIVVDLDFAKDASEIAIPNAPPTAQPVPAVIAPRDDLVLVEPVVARFEPGGVRQASLMQESPVRTVAVITRSLVPAAKTAVQPDRPGAQSGRALIVWGLLGLIAGLAITGLLLLRNNEPGGEIIAESVQLDREEEARVEDLEEGSNIEGLASEPIEELEVDVMDGAVDPGISFALSEAIEVGGLLLVNGESVLVDLADWHQGFATQRGIELGSSASCWFAHLGGAVVQVAHCGPVGGSADSEFLFDSVPLLFEESAAGQVAQPVFDAVATDTVLANALTLVGRQSRPPPLSLEGSTEGDQNYAAGD